MPQSRVKANVAGNVDHAKLETIERVHNLWNKYLDAKDVDGFVSLYAPDAVLESPLVRHILGTEAGAVTGRDRLRDFIEKVMRRTPTSRQFYRTGYFTDGTVTMWEYPHQTPDGEQMDFVEVMRIEDGLIKWHHVYWGWFGVKILEEDRYRR
jgi:ketosteroid isomerase-like protein